MENEVMRTILNRRSIRSYQDRQITDEERDAVLQAAVYAPSGSNNQSWLFTVIQSREVLEELNEVVKQAFSQMELEENEYPAKIAAKSNSFNPDYNFYYHAPTLVVASNVPGYANAMADCSCALENLFLAAHSFGLGTCWINQLRWLTDEGQVRDYLEKLGIPKGHVICGAASVGYAAGNLPSAPARKDGTVHIIR